MLFFSTYCAIIVSTYENFQHESFKQEESRVKKKKKQRTWLALLACIALFALAVTLSLALSRDEINGFQGTGGGHIVLSEIMASNQTYPAPNGQFLDYVEVRNLSDSATDISGYMLTDSLETIGYTFPKGTVLPAHGHIVVWCSRDIQSEEYAAFNIAKDGSDVIYLYNSANVIIDEKMLPVMKTNQPLVRLDDGTWESSLLGTPGFENSDAGYAEWFASMNTANIDVVISEVMTGSSCTGVDASGVACDWVELWNRGSTSAVLNGAFLSDDPADPIKWQIPSLTLEPGERTVIRCMGDKAESGDANFALTRDGCTVTLSGAIGAALSRVEVPLMGKDISWSLQSDGTYAATELMTPGYENTEAGYQQWLSACGITAVDVVISEVMPANYSTILNAAGKLCDWIELYNPGRTAVVLDGCYLSNDISNRGKWQIDQLTLSPGERVVIPCSGLNAAEGEASFNISRDGSTVVLSGTAGTILARTDLPAMEKDYVWALQADGSYAVTAMATPGFENTEEGYLAYNATRRPAGALSISEVMPANNLYYPQADGKYYDWVELVNNSDTAIDLSDYSLSDDPDRPDLLQLPQQTLRPGERIIIICSGILDLDDDFIQAPFTLSREDSWLYVTGPDGTFSDYIRIYDVPYLGTVGRIDGEAGIYYFTEPTPGDVNAAGVAFISESPAVLTKEGVYNDVDAVSVQLSAPGQIRYTLDGSVPTEESPVYEGPLKLTSTTVIRMLSYEEGKLPSDVITASYIINENHTLPVLSLVSDPVEMFGKSGVYTKPYSGKEIAGSLSLFENGEGFTINCGIEMHGHTSLQLPKRSFKINFRGLYGASLLTYEVFGEEGPDLYDSLCIRAGQDYGKTIFREQLFTSLCLDATDYVLAQRDKFCILYINGEYYGIYCLKEALGEMFYAENRTVTAESVDIEEAPCLNGDDMLELIRYARDYDMTNAAHYEYVTSRINIDSLIDWMIMEAYSGNGDIQQNLRYFRSSDNGNRWEYAFFDLDWAFYYENCFTHVLSSEKDWQHITLCRNMMKNPDFRARFLERVSYHMNNVLADENVLARIDYYETLLDPEVERERKRWGGSYESWQASVKEMREYLTTRDHWADMIDNLDRLIDLTDAEMKQYFGG